LDRGIKNGRSVLRAEDHMDKKERERLRHCRDYRSGLQPSYDLAHRTWGVAPCWYKAAPSALYKSY
jgi:hypothetical protein